MSDPLREAYGERIADSPEPSEMMRKRTFSLIDAETRRRRITGLVLRYVAAVMIVAVGGTFAMSFSHHDTPSQPTMVGIESTGSASTIAVSAQLTLEVRDVPGATRAIRALPQVSVTTLSPRDLHLHLPSRAYRDVLNRLATIGTVEHLDERRDNLAPALARAAGQPPTTAGADELAALRDRLAFAQLNIHLEPM